MFYYFREEDHGLLTKSKYNIFSGCFGGTPFRVTSVIDTAFLHFTNEGVATMVALKCPLKEKDVFGRCGGFSMFQLLLNAQKEV